MREIKFKAWDTVNKIMLYDLKMKPQDIDEYVRVCSWPDYIFLQFTGFYDNYKKEIYEGDLLFDPDDVSYVVVYWNEDKAAWGLKYRSGIIDDMPEFCRWCVIMGNIYENPEIFNR